VTKLFYSLHKGPRYIKEYAPSYWQHLTLDSYYVYERIYDKCNPQDRKVTCTHHKSHIKPPLQADPSQVSAFFEQFGPDPNPSAKHVFETWARLLRDKRDVSNSIHRKPFVMAILYMLHVESSLEMAKMTNIDPNRREMLKRFSKWVPCKCDARCGREWNFVNEVGLSRGGNGGDECDLLKLFDDSKWKLVFKSDKVRKLEATRKVWEASV
jgi:calcium-independent phospholipase A2-gamma